MVRNSHYKQTIGHSLQLLMKTAGIKHIKVDQLDGKRLIPFNFNLEHIPGKNMGFADYLSRHPKHKPPPPIFNG